MSRYNQWDYPRYVPAWERRAKVEKQVAGIMKKNPAITPLNVEGRRLARTWWGRAWNANLEGYADYANRMGRGRSYIRNGFVLGLQISPGEVTALVQGTRPRPYDVAVRITPLAEAAWERIKKDCSGRIESLGELIAGRFPEALAAMFTERGRGLFPSPGEIDFECTCPDWASMCKHVAAALYGVGVKLDDDPRLFFILRGVEMEKLIKDSLNDRSRDLLGRARRKTGRVIDEAEADRMFGLARPGEGAAAGKPAGRAEKQKAPRTRRRKAAGRAPGRPAARQEGRAGW